MQNLPATGVALPHFGQQNSIGSPHPMQNLALSGFSYRHFGHFISGLQRGLRDGFENGRRFFAEGTLTEMSKPPGVPVDMYEALPYPL